MYNIMYNVMTEFKLINTREVRKLKLSAALKEEWIIMLLSPIRETCKNKVSIGSFICLYQKMMFNVKRY